jgi:hypothetical protein
MKTMIFSALLVLGICATVEAGCGAGRGIFQRVLHPFQGRQVQRQTIMQTTTVRVQGRSVQMSSNCANGQCTVPATASPKK